MDINTIAAAIGAAGVIQGLFTAGFGYFVRSEIYRAVKESEDRTIARINGTYMRTEVWRPRIEVIERRHEREDADE